MIFFFDLGHTCKSYDVIYNLLKSWSKSNFNLATAEEDYERVLSDYGPLKHFFVSKFDPDKMWITEKFLFNKKDPKDFKMSVTTSLGVGKVVDIENVQETIIKFKAKQKELINVEEFNTPGIYRREHACLIISSGDNKIILDPILLSENKLAFSKGVKNLMFNGRFDKVFITHSHFDHFHVPTLCSLELEDEKIVIPNQKIESIISDCDMTKILKASNLQSEVLSWWDETDVGDIKVVSIPFYGEQPARNKVIGDEDVRMYGNCYLIQVDNKNIVCIADSGIEYQGSIIEELKKVNERFGKIDYLFATCGSFPEVLNFGLVHYSACFTFNELKRAYERRGDKENKVSITLGVKGLIDLFEEVEIENYYPYANGAADDRNIEENYLQELKELLKSKNIKTKIKDWSIGESIKL